MSIIMIMTIVMIIIVVLTMTVMMTTNIMVMNYDDHHDVEFDNDDEHEDARDDDGSALAAEPDPLTVGSMRSTDNGRQRRVRWLVPG